MDQRFTLRPMDDEGRTMSLVPDYERFRIAPVAMTVADLEASGEPLPERLKRVVAAAEGPTS